MPELKSDLLPVLEQIEKEKRIKKEEILKVIESSVISAYQKHVGENVNVEATIVPETAKIKAFVIKKTVSKVTNSNLEISIEQAKLINPDAELDSEIKIPLDTQEFSRIASQTAKQVIIQKIRESERINLFNEFKSKENTVVRGVVYRFINRNIIVDLGKTEGILPVREQIRDEQFRVGEHIRMLILNVDRGTRGPRILLSRSHPEFVKKLFELEVPEIYEKVVDIVGIAREPGARTKLAVISHNSKVDPVGACVGVKGSRIKPIIDELHGEHIDLILYSDEPLKFINTAFSPAKVNRVNIISQEQKKVEVITPDDMLALAIGKRGSNVMLASRLTGWQIDVKSETQKRQETEEKTGTTVGELGKLKGVGPKLAKVLFKGGFTKIEKIAQSKVEDLTVLQGVGKKTAQRIINAAKNEKKQTQKTKKS